MASEVPDVHLTCPVVNINGASWIVISTDVNIPLYEGDSATTMIPAGTYVARPNVAPDADFVFSDDTLGDLMIYDLRARISGDAVEIARRDGVVGSDGVTEYVADNPSTHIDINVEVCPVVDGSGRHVSLADLMEFAARARKRDMPVQDTLSPTTHYQGISKLSECALDVDNGEEVALNMGGRNEKRSVQTILGLSYEGDAISTSKPLRPFDESVHNAIATLWADQFGDGMSGRLTITPQQVFRVMTGAKSKPDARSLERVMDSIDRQRFIRVTLDWTAEMRRQRGDDVTKFKRETYMLNADKVMMTSRGGREVTGYVLNSPPVFYEHDKTTKQITSYPQRVLESIAGAVSSTPTNITLRDYALKRIARMRNTKAHAPKRITYDTWFKNIGRDDLSVKERQRLMRSARKILDALVGAGVISSWKEYETGGSSHRIEGVEIVL